MGGERSDSDEIVHFKTTIKCQEERVDVDTDRNLTHPAFSVQGQILISHYKQWKGAIQLA